MTIQIKKALLRASLLGGAFNYMISPSYGMMSDEETSEAKIYSQKQYKDQNIDVLLKKVEKTGDLGSFFRLGRLVDQKEKAKQPMKKTSEFTIVIFKTAKAFYWSERAKDPDDPEAWFELGILHEQGNGVEKNYATAHSYYEKAREQGYAAASRHLGMNYYNGYGVSKDNKKAREHLEEAEERGYKDGWMFNTLGLIYHEGKVGVKQDYEKANSYFEKAREQKYAAASRHLGMNYYNGYGVATDNKKAREYLEEAEEGGYKDGWMFNTLGLIYHEGKGEVKQDYKKANSYYEKGREQGYAAASRHLGMNYYNGYGVSKDHKKAREYLEEAAKKDYKEKVMFNTLGEIYYYGYGVPYDSAKSNAWYSKAKSCK